MENEGESLSGYSNNSRRYHSHDFRQWFVEVEHPQAGFVCLCFFTL